MSESLTEYRKSGNYFFFDSFQIFYHVEKRNCNEEGSVLLLLHGYPSSSYDFYEFFKGEETLNYCQIVGLDFLGFGFSDKPVNRVTYSQMINGEGIAYTINEQADIVEALVNMLKVNRLDIFSHDYGVSVAQELLSRNDDGSLEFGIDSITFLNGGLFPSYHKPLLIQQLLVSDIFGHLITPFINKFLLSKNVQKVFGPQTQPSQEYLDDLWALNRYHNGHWISHLLLQYIPDRKYNADRWTRTMNSTKVPLHIINGPSDPVSGRHLYDEFNAFAKARNDDVLTSSLLDENIGHWPQIESPTQVMRYFLDFVKSVRSHKKSE